VPTLTGGTGIVPTQLPGTTTTSTTTTVCLSNVPSDVDDTVLSQLIRPYGTVQSAHVLRDGCAVVTMSNGDEALRVLAAFSGRLLGDCVTQASLYSPPSAPAARPAGSLLALQPMLGLVPTATGACQTLLLRNAATGTAAAAVNGEMFLRHCLPQAQTYPHAQTYELVQLPIM